MNDGEIIKTIRSMHNYNQQGVAKKLCISQQAYAKWEKKEKICTARLNDILGALNSSISEFESMKSLRHQTNNDK